MQKLTVEQARKIAGISQREMANKLGISENTYINKEKGIVRFYVDEACKFSEIVGIEFDDIIFLNSMCQKYGT